MAESCGTCGGQAKKVLLYACSGGANVGEIADRAARELMYAGKGMVSCLAGMGGDIDGLVKAAREADMNLVIDGCPMDCAKKTFARHGVANMTHLRVTDLGIEKAKGSPCQQQHVEQVVRKATELL